MSTLLAILGLAAVGWYLWERSHRATRAMSGGLHPEITLPHEQPWELYHNDFSLCSKKTRVCLAELGVPYVSHHVDLIETGAYQNISRAFLAVNPGATVPVLVHEGHPIYESHEQLAYAASHSDAPDLLVPSEDEQRATMQRWVEMTSLVGDNPIADLDAGPGNAVPGLTVPIFAAMIRHIPTHRILEGLLFHRLKQRAMFFLVLKLRGLSGLTGMKPVMRVVGESRAAMHRHLDTLEQALEVGGGPWIVGAQFTLADVGMMVILDRLREVDWLDVFVTDERPRVRAYWQALCDRPSYQQAIGLHNHPTVERGRAEILSLKSVDAQFKNALAPDRTQTAP